MGDLAMKWLHFKMAKHVNMGLIIYTLLYHPSWSRKLESSKGYFVKPTHASYWKKELGINLPIVRSLNLYDSTHLKQAGIFGVGVSQFAYHFDTNVSQAFYELWGTLTNTLHYRKGEVGIFLYDLERIRGLPTLRATYEKILTANKDFTNHNKYPTAIVELVCVHVELYKYHEAKHIYYDL
ncbi:hypothetical protein Cgig2_012378 [Carnegiea gigantea]|uniref:Uncharacterized protein n=1 Tax=Carnegiea gigantea TaxID=171969 RepID=A0A9Q1KNH0_9CARY|nr:hypothetical protein Cgig2_012378 [Carnegiea gigantea]